MACRDEAAKNGGHFRQMFPKGHEAAPAAVHGNRAGITERKHTHTKRDRPRTGTFARTRCERVRSVFPVRQILEEENGSEGIAQETGR